MFIETQSTPNPSTLKFVPDCQIFDGDGGFEYRTPQEATDSPLASRLLRLEQVSSVFIGNNFISVTKKSGEWNDIKKAVLGQLIEHFISGKPAINKVSQTNQTSQDDSQANDADSNVVIEIKRLLDTRVRPAVAHDGGDITFHKYDNGIVYLQMRGACSGCPVSSVTLKQGIENLLKHFIKEVKEVRAIEL